MIFKSGTMKKYTMIMATAIAAAMMSACGAGGKPTSGMALSSLARDAEVTANGFLRSLTASRNSVSTICAYLPVAMVTKASPRI